MSELRFDPLKQRWTVIAPDRGDRPNDFRRASGDAALVHHDHDAPCPFCLILAGEAPAHRIMEYSVGRDQVLVVANRYPAYRAEAALERAAVGPYDRVSGVGAHEVVIASHRHDTPFHMLGVAQITATLRVWRDRLADLANDPRLYQLVAFKNAGPDSGASLIHPHSQIVAAPVASQQLLTELSSTRTHHERHTRCLACDIIAFEAAQTARLVEQGERFVALCPYASRHPFEVVIYPRRHEASFARLGDSDATALGTMLARTLQKLMRATGGADYNLTLHTSPNANSLGQPAARLAGLDSFWHWRLEITPRLRAYGGYEVGTGIHMNDTEPEAAAAHLRSLT